MDIIWTPMLLCCCMSVGPAKVGKRLCVEISSNLYVNDQKIINNCLLKAPTNTETADILSKPPRTRAGLLGTKHKQPCTRGCGRQARMSPLFSWHYIIFHAFCCIIIKMNITFCGVTAPRVVLVF